MRPCFPARLAACLLALASLFPVAAAAAEPVLPSRLEIQRLDGTRQSLADFQGAVTLLMLWSPESLASRKSFGELARFAASFQPRGLNTIAVSTTGDADGLRRFAEARQLDLPMALLGDSDLRPVPEQTLPVIYIFDREGTCRGTHRGLFRFRDLERLVEPLL